MYTAFDFDEYWNQFNQSPEPEFFDPVADLLFPGNPVFSEDLSINDNESQNELSESCVFESFPDLFSGFDDLNDLPEQLSLF